MTRLGVLAGTTALFCSLAVPARAIPITPDTLIATGGDVVVTFASNDAGYTSELFLDGLLGDGSVLFNNRTTPIGTTINLGSFGAGTELVFKLLVLQTGDAFYTGSADRNSDGQIHALIQNVAGHALVGFEDLRGGGDRDYNDLVFAFTNVSLSSQPGPPIQPLAVDEPSSLLMFGGGLAALLFAMKRQQYVRR
jgi:hypothetical protein